MVRLPLLFSLVVLFFRNTNGSSNDPVGSGGSGCKYVQPIYLTLLDACKDQPLFAVATTLNEESTYFDNVCLTLGPLKDGTGYVLYQSSVLINGTNVVTAFITSQFDIGVFRSASPSCTYTDTVFGEAGCDTSLVYRCYECGACPGTGRGQGYDPIIGISSVNAPINSSCLCKFKEIARQNGIPEQDYITLPMKLPTKCVKI